MELEFRGGESFSLGLEEELLLVDPTTRRLAPLAERVVPAIALPEALVAYEAYAAEIELRSPVSRDAGEATAALERGRGAAREAGAALMGAGVHPAGRWGDAQLVDRERYHRVGESMRGLLRRTPECALHVHVGMPDGETAIRAFNGLRAHLPLLQGLSANSPFWFGEDSGLASARSALVRPYPGRGVPPAFRDFDHYAETVAVSMAAGELDDYTLLWWDVRPHPRLGTIEVREMDAQSSLEVVAGLAALIHGLARHEAETADRPAVPTEAIAWSTFRAARDGVDATIVHEGRLRPLREVAREMLAVARSHLRELGGEAALDEVERILQRGGGADRQRAAYADRGMDGLLEMLSEETSAG